MAWLCLFLGGLENDKLLIKKLFFCLLLTPLIAFSAADTKEFKLDNGLKLIVKEDHRAPVVVVQIWYRVGALDEVNGKTGVAHVLEHMMFKGTKKIPAGQFSRLIAKVGGRENAFTSMDYTCYFQQLEKSNLPLAFELEADRMANLMMTQEAFAKEIKVVMEERRWRIEDNARSKVNEQLQALAFRAHPYGRPIVGHMNDLENMTIKDAQEWYERWYAPNNATMVVVGDVKSQEVLALAKQYFGGLQPKALPVRKPQVEPQQLGVRRAEIGLPGELPYLVMGFHVPALGRDANIENDWEPYALDVLVGVLSGHAAARLNQNLVRSASLAISVDASYHSTNRGRESLFKFTGTPAAGKTVSELEKALIAEIDKVKKDGITQKELNRVKTAAIAANVYRRDSMFYQGMLIGQLDTMGYDWRLLDVYIDKLKVVTAEQVQVVAKKYLTAVNMTVATLSPQPIASSKSVIKSRPNSRH